ncbi:MAG: GTPase ObgE [Chloroflexi bacterium]|nr:GTPase ObgE [Chloroflexota bacterium]
MTNKENAFLDEVKIHVQAGDGGNGIVAFRREKFVPRGGPNGGSGGPGGDVILEASPHQNTLIAFRRSRYYKAKRGAHGQGSDKTGRSGEDKIIPVPSGTVVRDAETGEMLGDLIEPGEQVIVARGGRGGRGNAAFASSTNQAPAFAEKGEPGEERWILLELKLLADVGIIGKPNAGKSTLLAATSAARPKIADYPFTTLAPNLGVVEVEYTSFVMADIPGLIEGAHSGIGLGDRFLRHIERTRVLVHMLDGATEDPLADFATINAELELYDPALSRRPQIVVLNKMDLPQARAMWPEIQGEMQRRGFPVISISAATGEGVRDLIYAVAHLLETNPLPAYPQELPVIRPEIDPDLYYVETDGPGHFSVYGKRLERLAAMTDWDNDEAIARFQRVLKVMGVFQALQEAGVEPGDTVAIGQAQLEWE